MKKSKSLKLFILNIIISALINSVNISVAQIPQNSVTKQFEWTKSAPFATNVFVENKGQFDKWAQSQTKIIYAINSSDKIFITNTGIIFRQFKKTHPDDNEAEENEEKARRNSLKETNSYQIKLQWTGCNPYPSVTATEYTNGYYTYGGDGLGKIKAKGYKKILLKNLYPFTDLEYSMPDSGGINTRFILHPGANIENIKMLYSGDFYDMNTDLNGNIKLETPAGQITVHSPVSSNIKKKTKVSGYNLKGNSVQIKMHLQSSDKKNQVILDTWTTTPSSLDKGQYVYDTDYDYEGNIYISGGSIPYKLAKYNRYGDLLWTYSNPLGFGYNCYSKFAVNRINGNIYIGEGINWDIGPRIIKLSTDGNIINISNQLGENNEIWEMYYNTCTSQLIGFGGGTDYSNNVKMISDTTLNLRKVLDFDGQSTTHNDIASVAMENNGDFYALVTTVMNNSINNHLMKSLKSQNYNLPLAFNVPTSYRFDEFRNVNIPGLNSFAYTVRANAVALNNEYVFTYDGKTLIGWDKNSGNQLSSVEPNQDYSDGKYRTHEGIDADDCNNIYIGGNNMIHVYKFDGISFKEATPITQNITGEVYDIKVDQAFDILYIGGNGFLTVANADSCSREKLKLKLTTGKCPNTTNLTVTGGTPPYRYLWSNKDTTQNITAKPGKYTVLVRDNSCIEKRNTDTIRLTSHFKIKVTSPDTAICEGFSTVIYATGAQKYTWTPDSGLSTTTGSQVIASPHSTTKYYVTGIDSGGCTSTDSIKIWVEHNGFPNPALMPICRGDTVILKLPGNSHYIWFPPRNVTPENDSVFIIYPDSTTNYLFIGTDQFGCKDTISFLILVQVWLEMEILPKTPVICSGDSIKLFPYNARAIISWYPTDSTRRINGDTIQVWPDTTTTYKIYGESEVCTDTASITVKVNPKPKITVIPDTATICFGSPLEIVAKGGIRYLWKPSNLVDDSTADSVNVLPFADTTFIVKGYNQYKCYSTAKSFVKVIQLPDIVVSPGFVYICPGDTVKLTLSGGVSYNWQYSPQIIKNMGDSVIIKPQYTNVYNVTGTDKYGCDNIASVIVYVGGNELYVYPNPVNLCKGDSVMLTCTGAEIYMWKPSSGLSSDSGAYVFCHADTSTNYYVQGFDTQGCNSTDTIVVNVITKPKIFLGNDTTICHGTHLTLNAGINNATYSWNDSTSNETLIINKAGTYSVTVTIDNTCSVSDSIKINLYPILQVFIGKDTSICRGDFITLTPGTTGISYIWSNYSTNRTITVQDTGYYSVTVTDKYGCEYSDTIKISNYPYIPVNLGKRVDTLEIGSTCKLSAGTKYVKYRWQDGAVDSVLYVTKDGKYWVETEDKWGCNYSDTVNVIFYCSGKDMEIPNVFTPNNDNHNDVFLPVGHCISDFDMKIYNRYGVLVFESNDIDKGWNGKIDGDQNEASEGVYFYVITYNQSNKFITSNHSRQGSVTLLR